MGGFIDYVENMMSFQIDTNLKFYGTIEFIYMIIRKIEKMSNEELMVMEHFFNKWLEEISVNENEEFNVF